MNEAAEHSALIPMDRLVAASSQLYSLPDIYLKVRDIIFDPESQITDLGDVLMTDPGLSARLLRISNSAFFGLANEVGTISRAVQVIGFQHIHDLVVATSISKAFRGVSNDIMSIESFWIASVERALIARMLAERKRLPNSERMFVGGLLLDIGHLVMYEHIPEAAQQAISHADDQFKPLHLAEVELLGFSAAELGSDLARKWQLPESLSDQILYQDRPELLKHNAEVAIVHVAKCLAGTAAEPDAIGLVFDAISADVKAILNLTFEDCEQLLAGALGELSETLELIIPQG